MGDSMANGHPGSVRVGLAAADGSQCNAHLQGQPWQPFTGMAMPEQCPQETCSVCRLVERSSEGSSAKVSFISFDGHQTACSECQLVSSTARAGQPGCVHTNLHDSLVTSRTKLKWSPLPLEAQCWPCWDSCAACLCCHSWRCCKAASSTPWSACEASSCDPSPA